MLGYYPAEKKWDGKYRRLEVKVARADVRVRHRTGYYAIDTAAEDREADKEQRSRQLMAALTSPLPATLVTFQARVVPPASGTPTAVQVELEVDAAGITYEEGKDARRTANLDFLTTAYNPDGTLAANVYQSLVGSLPPEGITNLSEQRIPYRAQLTLSPGTYEIRLAVRDNRTGFIGTLRIPLDLRTPRATSQ